MEGFSCSTCGKTCRDLHELTEHSRNHPPLKQQTTYRPIPERFVPRKGHLQAPSSLSAKSHAPHTLPFHPPKKSQQSVVSSVPSTGGLQPEKNNFPRVMGLQTQQKSIPPRRPGPKLAKKTSQLQPALSGILRIEDPVIVIDSDSEGEENSPPLVEIEPQVEPVKRNNKLVAVVSPVNSAENSFNQPLVEPHASSNEKLVKERDIIINLDSESDEECDNIIDEQMGIPDVGDDVRIINIMPEIDKENDRIITGQEDTFGSSSVNFGPSYIRVTEIVPKTHINPNSSDVTPVNLCTPVHKHMKFTHLQQPVYKAQPPSEEDKKDIKLFQNFGGNLVSCSKMNESGQKTRKINWKCWVCENAELSSEGSVKAHFKTEHPDLQPFRCQYCSTSFRKFISLQAHENSHTGAKPHICTSCGQGFKGTEILYWHRRKVHGLQPKTVKQEVKVELKPQPPGTLDADSSEASANSSFDASMSFMEASEVEKLAKSAEFDIQSFQYLGTIRCANVSSKDTNPGTSQSRTRNWVCWKCEQELVTQVALVEHFKSKHENLKPFLCKFCPSTFTTPFYAKQHEKSHCDDAYKCQICKKTFKSYYLYLKHQKSHQDNPDGPPKVKRSKMSADSETINTSVADSNVSVEENPSTSDTNSYNCTHCRSTFQSKVSLAFHIKAFHTETDSPPTNEASSKSLQCSVCNARFSKKIGLHIHRKKHPELYCIKCKVTFDQPNLKNEHNCSVIGDSAQPGSPLEDYDADNDRDEDDDYDKDGSSQAYRDAKTFKCDICKQYFLSQLALNVHFENIHEQVVPINNNDSTNFDKEESPEMEQLYSCKICGLSFTYQRSLHYHRQSHPDVLQCVLCGLEFTSSCEKTAHICWN